MYQILLGNAGVKQFKLELKTRGAFQESLRSGPRVDSSTRLLVVGPLWLRGRSADPGSTLGRTSRPGVDHGSARGRLADGSRSLARSQIDLGSTAQRWTRGRSVMDPQSKQPMTFGASSWACGPQGSPPQHAEPLGAQWSSYDASRSPRPPGKRASKRNHANEGKAWQGCPTSLGTRGSPSCAPTHTHTHSHKKGTHL